MALGGRITKVNDRLYLVNHGPGGSSSNEVYKVRWTKKCKWVCNCPDYIHHKQVCPGIYAVNFMLRLPELLMVNNGALSGGGRCPNCGSHDLSPYGSRYNKRGAVRRFMCNSCGRTCKDPTTHQDMSSNIAFAIISLDLFYRKLSYREIQNHLFQIYGVHKPVSTIRNWVLKFTRIIVSAAKKLEIAVSSGGHWLGDEMVIKVSGKRRHLWNVLNYKDRHLLVSILMKGRGAREASKVIEMALKKSSGSKPAKMLTDGLESYVGPLKANGITHVANVGLADKKNNNRLERLHGSIRQFVRAKRGLKSNAATLLQGHSIYYNCIRPHMSLGDRSPIDIGSGKGARWAMLMPSKMAKKHKALRNRH